MRVSALLVPALALITSCRNTDGPIVPDPAFTPYIPAFTAGHISARSPILVRIAEGQIWKDSSNAALQQLFELDPSTEGTVSWQDRTTLSFLPAKRLEQEKTYTVTFHLNKLIEVPSNLSDFKFSVTTYRQGLDVKVTDLQPLSTTDLTWQRVLLAVYTSDDATGQDLEGCFSAEQGGKELHLTWEHEPNGNFHRLAADSVRRGDTPNTVTFHWNGQKIGSPDSGDLPFEVPALGDLKLIGTETFSDGEQYASLLFSDPLDPAQDLTGLATINGAENVRVALNGNKLLLYPQDQLTGPQQAFVAAGLTNVAHKPLGKDVIVDLNFEELKPNLRITGNGTILPSTDGLLFPFEAVNLKAVDVRVIRIYADNVPQFLQVNDLTGERELARVGRPVLRTTVPLQAKDRSAYRKWNTYYLDLDKLIKAEPGAIYRIQLGFRQAYSTYTCADAPTEEVLTAAATEEGDDEGQWDNPNTDYYYYEDYYEGDYDSRERSEPCSSSYFYNKGTVVERNILASDLGLIAKRGNDGSVLVAVSDIRSTAPLSG
ncbi:MAG TPA: hypothetical protein VHL57_11465, partial [Flavobacteriales bacterium]|nr:hypothetical protein [Flavobacteriales bacterium]